MKKLRVLFLMFVAGICLSRQASASLIVNLEKIIVTTGRLEQEGHRVAGNVSVITKDQIAESNVQSVPELLQQVEGIFAYDFSTTRTSIVDIRGFGDAAGRNVLVLIDGRRLNTINSGAADLVQVPVESIERLEIIRGGGSVLYGDNATGGVINIVTKKGEGKLSGSAGVLYGSYGTIGENMEISGAVKKLSYYLSAKYLDKKGFRENSDELYRNFSARFDYDITDKIAVGIQYGYHDDSYELPGGLNETEIVTLGRRGSADQGDIAETNDQYLKLSFQVDPMPEDTYWGHFVIDTTWRKRELFDVLNAFDFITNRDVATKGLTGKYVFDQTILDRKVDFVTGIDYYNHENDILGSGTNSDDITISRDDIGFFTNMEAETIDDLFLLGGVRHFKAKYTFNQRSGTPNFEEQKPSETVASAGLKYEYGKGSNVHFNYQQTFRFLTTDEWYSSFTGLDTSLKQQTGDQYEIGIKHNFDNKAIVSVTPYLIYTTNEIFFDPTSGFFGSNSNYDKTQRKGVEFGSRIDIKEFIRDAEWIQPFQKLEFYTNYTYQNPEFKEGSNNGKIIPFVPTHQANTGIVAKLFDHYHISLMGNYVGSRYAINDIGNALPKAKPYFVTNLKVAYERDNYEIYMGVHNLFDRQYETYHATNNTLTVRDVFPAPEKNFVWGVNFKF